MRITEAMLEELVNLETEIKIKTKRVDEIKNLCRERGTFSTARYVCIVSPMSRQQLEGLERVVAVFGRPALETANLIKEVTFKTVKVQAKLGAFKSLDGHPT